MRIFRGKNWVGIGMLIVMLLCAVPVSASTSVQVVYSYEQEESTIEAPEGKPYISGSQMVWKEQDDQGHEQVYYENLNSQTKVTVTSTVYGKDVPKVGTSADGHVYVVWLDKRNYGPNQPVGDLYAFDVASSREWKLNSTTHFFTNYSLGGSDVVARDDFTGEMIHFDLTNNTETQIGKGRSPAVAKGGFLYINDANGGLSFCNLRTGELRSVLTLPPQLNVINIDYNGKYALYKQADLDWNTKYVMLNVSDPSAKPVDLTPATKKPNEYYQLYIGEGQAAWLQDTGSGLKLMGADLQRSEAHVIFPQVTTGGVFTFMGDDRLVTRAADGKLMMNTIIRTEVTPNSGSDNDSAAVESQEVKKLIGVQGGELDAADGSVKLVIPRGAVLTDTTMGLKLNEAVTAELAADDSTRKTASKAWDVQLGGGLIGTVQIRFGYEPDRWSELQTHKLLLHRWNEASQTWEPLRPKLDTSKHTVTSNIDQSGTYALFDKEVSFADVQQHWSQQAVEVLAARGIISGVSDGKYDPDGVVTRAQFAKMLLGALDLKPKEEVPSVFTDVPASHWAAKWVATAATQGLVQGEGSSFRPDDEISREQMMAMIVRALGDEAKANALSETQLQQGLQYADAGELSDWARRYAALSSQSGLIEGDGQHLAPKQSSTRAQAAIVIYRLLQRLQQF